MNTLLILKGLSILVLVVGAVWWSAPARGDVETVEGETVWLSSIMNPRHTDWEYRQPAADRAITGEPLTVQGRVYEKGVGAHAETRIAIEPRGARRFVALAGLEDGSQGRGSIRFSILADEQVLWQSPVLRGRDEPVPVNVEIPAGATQLMLIVEDAEDGIDHDHGAWLEARFEVQGEPPVSVNVPRVIEAPYILTPPAPRTPRINGARVFGVRPGSPFLFTIPATGDRPMTFSVDGLPEGLEVDAQTGRITGRLDEPGEHVVTLRAENELGVNEREFRIVVGDKIALTPPMGWNSWNVYGAGVSQELVARNARAMHETGLVNHGWTYINIDDAWQANRGGEFNAIQPNEKFPDMAGLVEEIHSLGLKAGIYSTPWVQSYAGYCGGSADNSEGHYDIDLPRDREHRRDGQYLFAEGDAKQWAAWGIDYLKYDWNPRSAPARVDNETFRKQVADMAEALRSSGRDIVYSYSNSMPFDAISEVAPYLNVWRTTGDILDTWQSVRGIGFSQGRWATHAQPGHWNDPDMLVVGHVGWGPQRVRPTNLTPNEQYTHISLWCLLSAPLLLGCDLAQLDEFTLSLLTNDEVIEVNQDPLGRQATPVVEENRSQVWAKQMEDGSMAVGLFNLGRQPATVSVAWEQLGVSGPQRVRDLWRQEDVGVMEGRFEAEVPRHGVVLVRVWPEE